MCYLSFLHLGDSRLSVGLLHDELFNHLRRSTIVLTVLVEPEVSSFFLLSFVEPDHLCPCVTLEQSFSVPDDEEKVSGPCDGYIESSDVSKET